MRALKMACGVLAMAMLVLGQEGQPKTVRKLIPLKYVSADKVHSLLQNYTGASIQSDDRLHMIAVRGTEEMVAAMEEAVKKLDVAPLGFEMTVYLISTSAQGADHLPEALLSTAKQLHGVFAYKGYELLDSFVLRGKDGQQGASASGTIKNSTYSFRYNRAAVLSGPPIIVNLQNVNLQIRTPTGQVDEKGNARFTTTGLDTDVDVKDGQKVVVGKSDMNNGDSPLIVVVTVKAVD